MFLQAHGNKSCDLLFPRLIKRTRFQFHHHTISSSESPNNFLQNSLQEAYLNPSPLLFG